MQVGTSELCTLDVTKIGPKLWQGSLPEIGDKVRRCGFDVLVLTAEEWQPPRSAYPGVEVIHVSLQDHGQPLTEEAWNQAVVVSGKVARRVLRGKRVLTTCFAGLNRSGIVNVLALYQLTGISGKKLVQHVQRVRSGALSNPHFVRAAELRLSGR